MRSRNYTRLLCFVATVVVLAAMAPSAWANCQSGAVSTFNSVLTSPDTALVPFPGPYGTVTVDLLNPAEACITFTSGSSGGFTYLFVDGSSADVNVNATSFTPSFSSATGPTTGGFVSPSFVGFGSGQVDNQGNFNLTTDMFDSTDHAANDIEFTVTNNSGTWSSAANVLTANGAGNDAAAHIVVFNSGNVNNGNQITTGFVGEAGGTVTTPEPASVLFLGTMMLGAGAILRRRMRSRRS